MFTAWLANMIVVVMVPDAGSAKWHTGSPSLFGDGEYEMRQMLGTPNAQGVWPDRGYRSASWFRYERVDWLGGRRERFIKSLGRVYEDQERYLPFAEMPPWLESVRNALTPVGRKQTVKR